MSTFDQIITQGRYQRNTFIIVSLIDFTDGIEKIFLAVLLSILSHQWNLTQNQVTSLASIFFIGIVCGTLYSAFFADKFGRRSTLLYSSLLASILIVWHALAQNFYEIYFLRYLFGVVFGVTIPISNILISEVVHPDHRGKIMILVAIIFILGKIYSSFLSIIFLDDFTSGNWRIYLLFNGVPLLICFLGCLTILRESPRYLISKQQYSEAFSEIEYIFLINGGIKRELNEEEKESLIRNENKIHKSQVSIGQLFNNEMISVTIRIWILFILTSIFETTLYILMPFWLTKIKNVLYLMLSELAASFMIFFVIDIKQIGRTKLLIIIASLISFVCGLIYLFQILVFGLALLQFLLRILFSTEMIMMQEVYQTQFRTMGVGMTQTVGKLTGALSPYLIFMLYNRDPYYPFLLYIVCMVLIMILAYNFPFDMTKKELDCEEIFQIEMEKV